jgi:hypothetical protein
MPDLEALYQRFGAKGFVVLGISDAGEGWTGIMLVEY